MSELTIATLNLRGTHFRWHKRRLLLVSALLDLDADIVGFQEVDLAVGQGRWLTRKLNARMKSSSPLRYQLVQARRSKLLPWQAGIGVLTRLPLVYHDSLDLGSGGCVALRLNLELPSRQTFDFVSTQLHPLAGHREARLEQAMALLGWLSGKRRVPLQLLAGDFNEPPDAAAIQYIKQSYRSAYEEVHGREPVATFPTALRQPPGVWAGCLDYVFLSAAVYKVNRAFLFGNRPAEHDDTLYLSDHVGIAVRVELERQRD